MDNNFYILKTKCDICGRTFKKVIAKEVTETNPYVKRYNEKNVCIDCDRKYKITDCYSARGYGYKWSTDAHFTIMDKNSTPTYGVEIEVAGNIINIDKIARITDRVNGNSECSIGYDTSVEGAMFELSYAPGTYYWYLYESNLKAVCKLLQKDIWANEESPTIGMHIHVGNINLTTKNSYLNTASKKNALFWEILRLVGGREYNRYCRPVFSRNHHDAISRSTRWRTIEFRMFKGTYDFTTIMNRIKFIRQLLDNTDEQGTHWEKFSEDTKKIVYDLIEKEKGKGRFTDEELEKIRKVFETGDSNIEYKYPDYIKYWEKIADEEYYGEEEYDEDEEEESEGDY